MPPTLEPEDPPGPRRARSAHSWLEKVQASAIVIATVTGIVMAAHDISEDEKTDPPARPPVAVIILCEPRPDPRIEPAAAPEQGNCRVVIK